MVSSDYFFGHMLEEAEKNEGLAVEKRHHEPWFAHQVCDQVEAGLKVCSAHEKTQCTGKVHSLAIADFRIVDCNRFAEDPQKKLPKFVTAIVTLENL